MKTRTGISLAVLATAIFLLCQIIQPALAQDQDQGPPPEPPNASAQSAPQPDQPDQAQPDQGQPAQDPPTRAGRISVTDGSVSFQPGGQGDWVTAVPNRPLTTGDNLWVDKDSRAEIQIGGTSIRLGPETSVTFLDLGDNVTQLRLSLGSLMFRVRHFDHGEAFEVDTPNLAFNVNQPGEFRLDVNQNGDQTLATVFHGAGEVTGAGNSYRLTEGQQGTFSGTDTLSYDVGEIPQPDSFTEWCLSRDEREDQARSRQYMSDQMTGYEDLDDYGQWRSTPDYGNVWYPTGVAVGWAPYRFGHWAYVYPWGWTWVEDEPWGFAPFHYGRWAFVGGYWGWVPGPVAVRPVYAPALVAFVGGISIGVGTAPVGWFPLGPREVFVPWYHTSPVYVQNVNITNTHVTVVQVTNVYHNYTVNHVTNVTYVNEHVANSVTVVNHDTFVNARPVNANIVHVDARTIASARVNPTFVTQVQPARQSVIGVAHPVQYRPPAQALSRPVVATRQPVAFNRPGAPAFARPVAAPPVRTVRPAAQPQALQRGERGGPPANAGTNRPSQPNAPVNRGAAPRPGAPSNAPENSARPGGPAPNRNVPRPPSANPQPEQQQRQYPGTRPENNRPESAPQAQPSRPAETPQATPENARPSQETPRTTPEQPSRAPETRQEPPPRQPESRPQPTPRAEPQRNAPRPQAHPAETQHESRPAEHNEKPPKEEKEKKEPSKFR